MSRSHRRSTSGGISDSFPIVILLACLTWTNKALMVRVERWATITMLVVGGMVAMVAIIKLIKRVKSWRRVHRHDIEKIDHMTGLEFEQYVANLLKTHGYKHVKLTEKYDLGIDIIAEKDGIRWGIQVKRYNGLVGASAVRQVVTALKKYECDKAMVVTNSVFSRTAQKLAEINNCVLVDRVKLFQENGSIKTGVKVV